jgi:hypothetical protein
VAGLLPVTANRRTLSFALGAVLRSGRSCHVSKPIEVAALIDEAAKFTTG